MKFENSDYVNRDNKYLYYGKELIEHSGLDCYDYGARMYDAGQGRFQTQDPALELYYEWSPYNYVGSNPIIRTDPTGMIWDVTNDQDSKNDVRSLAKEDNQDYITFDENGRVGLDFGDLSDKKIQKILKKDKGLLLVNDLVNAKDKDGNDEKYYYAASSKMEFEGKQGLDGEWKEYNAEMSPGSGVEVKDNSWFGNFSTTLRGDESKNNEVYTKPANGYDGSVFIANGTMTARTGYSSPSDGYRYTGYGEAPRNSIIYHELCENYIRTNGKQPYDKANNLSIIQEGSFYNNVDRGNVIKFKYK